jgi:hypothetical protein
LAANKKGDREIKLASFLPMKRAFCCSPIGSELGLRADRRRLNGLPRSTIVGSR